MPSAEHARVSPPYQATDAIKRLHRCEDGLSRTAFLSQLVAVRGLQAYRGCHAGRGLALYTCQDASLH